MSNATFPRGVAINGFTFQLINRNNGQGVTSGTVTVNITKDGVDAGASTNTATHIGGGQWKIDLTASERDATITALRVSHTDAVTQVIQIVTDSQLGPGAKAVTLQFGVAFKEASFWVTTSADESTVIASGLLDSSGNATVYLDLGTYKVFGQKSGYNYTPTLITVTGDQTNSFTVTASASPLSVTAYASISDANSYFATRLWTEKWDEASSTNQNKALLMATRAINRLDFVGSPTQSAFDLGNQFPRGDDTEIPDDIVYATCEEALKYLDGFNPEEEEEALRVITEKYSNISTTFDDNNQPAHIRSGIVSITAWRYLIPYLRNRTQVGMVRV